MEIREERKKMTGCEKTYNVYKLTSPSNKVYIGCTYQDPKDRWDCGRKYHHNKELTDDIQRFGWEQFEHDVLYSNLTEEEAFDLERDLIHIHKSCHPEYGYNKTHGGKTNPGIIRDDSYRKRLSERTTGENHHFYGKHLSNDHRQKISESNKGHIVSRETRIKIGDANRGRFKSDEAIQKWRDSRHGYTHSEATKRKIGEGNRGKIVSEETRRRIGYANKGRITSEETKEKLSKSSAKKRKVICVETGVVYDSMREAAETMGTPASNVGSVCRGKTKTAGGYSWKYMEENGNEQKSEM